MPEVDECVAHFEVGVLIKRVAPASGLNTARKSYYAFTMFLSLQHLKFEAGLKLLCRSWGPTPPKVWIFLRLDPPSRRPGTIGR